MNEKSKIFENLCFASRMFAPHKLAAALVRSRDGTVYADTGSLLLTEGDWDLWCTLMGGRYRWDFSRPGTSTVYLYTKGERVYGGIYDTETRHKTNPRLIASVRGAHVSRCPYIYTPQEMKNLQNAINGA